ncbi:Copper-containing nitrite reductase [Salinisphaera sp. LB1]|nr:copper-containing nitrite reductase [Salinisphaera sp. LB1]AWN17936.1 Copper-containing nitrite reductase [Salinisphaera sp. LB1]
MEDPRPRPTDLARRQFLRIAGAGAVLLSATGGLLRGASAATPSTPARTSDSDAGSEILGVGNSIAADARRVPQPITRDHAVHHDIELMAREVTACLDNGARFDFMTWNGQVPGPFLRVRQDDTVTLTLTSPSTNTRPHSIDLHAVYGTGGGSAATLVVPGGQSKAVRFKCLYPGAFIYHCAVPNLDEHISRGMFGMIVVEPHEGLPPVDREFYLGQHELYTREPFGSKGLLHFDDPAMIREQPHYVVFNGAVDGYTPDRLGRLHARVGETIRVFMVSGGPNLLSSFHPIGNVWARCWPQGALANPPLKYIQTQPVPPGSCFVGDMALPVPETIKLVDHALSRVVHQGLLAEIEVSGAPNPAVYNPSP